MLTKTKQKHNSFAYKNKNISEINKSQLPNQQLIITRRQFCEKIQKKNKIDYQIQRESNSLNFQMRKTKKKHQIYEQNLCNSKLCMTLINKKNFKNIKKPYKHNILFHSTEQLNKKTLKQNKNVQQIVIQQTINKTKQRQKNSYFNVNLCVSLKITQNIETQTDIQKQSQDRIIIHCSSQANIERVQQQYFFNQFYQNNMLKGLNIIQKILLKRLLTTKYNILLKIKFSFLKKIQLKYFQIVFNKIYQRIQYNSFKKIYIQQCNISQQRDESFELKFIRSKSKVDELAQNLRLQKTRSNILESKAKQLTNKNKQLLIQKQKNNKLLSENTSLSLELQFLKSKCNCFDLKNNHKEQQIINKKQSNKQKILLVQQTRRQTQNIRTIQFENIILLQQKKNQQLITINELKKLQLQIKQQQQHYEKRLQQTLNQLIQIKEQNVKLKKQLNITIDNLRLCQNIKNININKYKQNDCQQKYVANQSYCKSCKQQPNSTMLVQFQSQQINLFSQNEKNILATHEKNNLLKELFENSQNSITKNESLLYQSFILQDKANLRSFLIKNIDKFLYPYKKCAKTTFLCKYDPLNDFSNKHLQKIKCGLLFIFCTTKTIFGGFCSSLQESAAFLFNDEQIFFPTQKKSNIRGISVDAQKNICFGNNELIINFNKENIIQITTAFSMTKAKYFNIDDGNILIKENNHKIQLKEMQVHQIDYQ